MEKQNSGITVTYVLIACLFVIFAVIMYSLLLPFKPMDLESYYMVPATVCPAELIAVDSDLTIEEGNYLLIVDPVWTNVNDGRYWDIAEATIPIEGPIKQTKGTSSLTYMTPPERGLWQFSVSVEVHGRRGILPRVQYVEPLESDNITKVVDCGSSYSYNEYQEEKKKKHERSDK